MDIADPPAAQALDIKFLKKTDPDADKNGSDNTKERSDARWRWFTSPASTAKITTANRIEVSLRRVEIESGAKAKSMVVVIAPISGERKE